MLDYFSEHETRPHHFFIPMLIAIVGGIFAHIQTWEWVGYLIFGITAANVFFLVYSAIKKHQLNLIRAEQDHYAEIMKLDAAKTTTKVVIDKTPLMGQPYQNFSELNIAPAKLVKFARGVMIEGKPMTIREWTPLKKGRLFSDPEWRRLIAFMKQPDWEDKHTKFIIPINPNNDQDSFELTAAGRKWLEDITEKVVLTSISA